MSRVEHSKSATAVLLGPQRRAPIVGQALDQLEIRGTVAVITAGWQEREAEDAELMAALGRPGINLHLHARGDDVFAGDPQLFEANRAKQDRLKALQRAYRRRLRHIMGAAQEVHRLGQSDEPAATDLPADLLELHQASAVAALQALDAEHADYVRREITGFFARYAPTERPEVARHRAEIQAIVTESDALAIAGGHVVVLLNRMRLFGLQAMLARKPIVAWSAGAMALTERVVLFHDSPPQGRGDAEMLGDGLARVPGVVALPHAKKRLLLDDRGRIALFARRFAPARCITLDQGSWLRSADGRPMRAGDETFALTESGEREAPSTTPEGAR